MEKSMPNSFNPAIFHDYDVRGTYPDEVNEETYKKIGKALAIYIHDSPIAVGHDMRLSSPSLCRALIEGIISQGFDVVDLGLISTEMHYFASGRYGFAANAVVSASHNPPQYNGLKIVKRGVIALNGDFGLPNIKDLASKNKFKDAPQKGQIVKKDIMADWIKHALTFIDMGKLKPLKIVVDAGNGMAGISWQMLLDKLPLSIIPMYFEPDGTFPHHIPNPLEEKNLVGLKKEIIKQNADLGFSFDGDADRLFILDEKAQVLSGTVTTAILARYFLTRYGPHTVLYNAICGRIVPETVAGLGGKAVRVRVGHSFIKEYMKKYQAIFAGEHSGHYYFRDNYNAESSLIAALTFLSDVSASRKKVSELASEFEKYPQSGEINFTAPDIKNVMDKIKKEFSAGASSVDELDGISVWFPDFWFNVRASKTEPLLRLNVEADNLKILKYKKEELIDRLYSLGAKLKK